MKNIVLLIFVIYSFTLYSQKDKSAKTNYKLICNFDMRNSFVIGHSLKFNGLQLGLGNSKHRFGIGFYGLRQPVTIKNRNANFMDATDTTRYYFGFFSFYFEKIVLRSKRWEFSIPCHFNLGELRGEYWITEKIYKEYLKIPASSFTFFVKSHFKVFRWIGFTGGLGYNLMTNKDFKTRQALNAPFCSFGVKLFLGEAWKLTTKKTYRKSPWIN